MSRREMRMRSRRRTRAGAVLAAAASAALVSALTFGAIVPAQADDGIAEPASAQVDASLSDAQAELVEPIMPEVGDVPVHVEATDAAPLPDHIDAAPTDSLAEATAIPGRTVLRETVLADGFRLDVSNEGDPNAVDLYIVTVTRYGTDDVMTKTSEHAGVIEVTGLQPGVYALSATSQNAHGSTGMSAYSVLPYAPSTPEVSLVDVGVAYGPGSEAGQVYAIGEVRFGENRTPVPSELAGQVLTPTVAYEVTLSGGGEDRVFTSNNWITQIGRFAFWDLEASTDYAVTVVATNVAGSSAPVTLSISTPEAGEPQPPVVPAAPSGGALIDATRGEVTVPSTALPGSTVTVRVDPALAGASLHGWLFSEPTALGVAIVQLDGSLTFTIPTSVPAGTHRLALTSPLNDLIGWGFVEVPTAGDDAVLPGVGSELVEKSASIASRPASGELARTGVEAPIGLVAVGALLLMAGAGLLVARRRTS